MICVGKRVYPAVGKWKEERAGEQGAEVAIDFPRDFSSETGPARFRKEGSRRRVSPGGMGLEGAVNGSSPQPLGPALNRQAGFTAARPAANW